MIKRMIFVCLVLASLSVHCQDLGLIDGLNVRHFRIVQHKDTIDFIKANGGIDSVKPVLIFLQGSQPIPLIVHQNRTVFITALSNFDYEKLSADFHIIVISMPHVPLEMVYEKLSRRYYYITDPLDENSYPPAYLADNYAERYIQRAMAVIDFLHKQKWVAKHRINLFGHSQGSMVAVEAALNNPKISRIGYSGGNPMGRIDQMIREQRKLVAEKKISAEAGQQEIESIYAMWEEICKDPDAVTTAFGDPNRTWTSFSRPLLADLLKLNQPLYVSYGTEDITSTFCDLLPLYFTKANKKNLTLRPLIGLDHNFFEVDAAGRPDHNKGHWQEVINDFAAWTKR